MSCQISRHRIKLVSSGLRLQVGRYWDRFRRRIGCRPLRGPGWGPPAFYRLHVLAEGALCFRGIGLVSSEWDQHLRRFAHARLGHRRAIYRVGRCWSRTLTRYHHCFRRLRCWLLAFMAVLDLNRDHQSWSWGPGYPHRLRALRRFFVDSRTPFSSTPALAFGQVRFLWRHFGRDFRQVFDSLEYQG